MKSIYELQHICLQGRKKQDELFEIDLKYFIKNIEEQIEENAENGIDTTKCRIVCGESDIGTGYIKHARFQDVISRVEKHFTEAGFEVQVCEDILEIKLPLCQM